MKREPGAVPSEPSLNTCATCGTEVPAYETNCAICERAAAARLSRATGKTLVHWMIFLAVMTVIMAGGYALSP